MKVRWRIENCSIENGRPILIRKFNARPSKITERKVNSSHILSEQGPPSEVSPPKIHFGVQSRGFSQRNESRIDRLPDIENSQNGFLLYSGCHREALRHLLPFLPADTMSVCFAIRNSLSNSSVPV